MTTTVAESLPWMREEWTEKHPGVYRMTNAEYHACKGAISKSGLDKIAKSPATYFYSLTHEEKTTPAMAFGTLFHTAVLEPDTLDDLYLTTDLDGRTNAYKDLIKANPGKTVVKMDDWDNAQFMADAVRKHSNASRWLSDGEAETSIFWEESWDAGDEWVEPATHLRWEAGSALCRCRPDYIRGDHIMSDLKSTTDASEDAFMRAAYNYRYHVQASFYMSGLRAIGREPLDFFFIVCEKEAPWEVRVFRATPEFLAAGEAQYKRDVRLFAQCRNDNFWPGVGCSKDPDTGAYYDYIAELNLPPWAKTAVAETSWEG